MHTHTHACTHICTTALHCNCAVFSVISQKVEMCSCFVTWPSSVCLCCHCHADFILLQAKERELELKNAWSQNRMTKNQSRSKYGFWNKTDGGAGFFFCKTVWGGVLFYFLIDNIYIVLYFFPLWGEVGFFWGGGGGGGVATWCLCHRGVEQNISIQAVVLLKSPGTGKYIFLYKYWKDCIDYC